MRKRLILLAGLGNTEGSGPLPEAVEAASSSREKPDPGR